MGRFLFLCLILVEVFLILPKAHGSESNVPKVGNSGESRKSTTTGPGLADPPSFSSEANEEVAEAPEIRRMGMHNQHHHSPDKSIAGGGVIIGGLATAIFAAVFCYIRLPDESTLQIAKSEASS